MSETPKINASPTKEFFITIITRDVLLYQAISDLVDNCVDGALRIRPDGNYNGLLVKVNFNQDTFSIEDNCGGIDSDIAINYAFRFGRPHGMPETPGSVGQFGVGMKRSLFKIGNHFNITSISPTSNFILDVDVNEWRSLIDEQGKEKWEFEFTELNREANNEIESCGTTITVKNLHQNVALDFELENFRINLIESLRSQHEESLAKGLIIEVNNITLSHDEASLLYSNELKPFHSLKKVESEGQLPVFIDVYAGIVRDADMSLSGWYISCNGRLILKANKTSDTGWQEVYEKITIPKPHYQFARFRGYVRFRSNDSNLLPWNTTKSGLDTGSAIYQSTKLDMIVAMRQVIDFLNKLDTELDSGEDLLIGAINNASAVKVADIPEQSAFVFPNTRPATFKPKDKKISYSRPSEQVEAVKEALNANTLKEVGELTFDYYMHMEEIDVR